MRKKPYTLRFHTNEYDYIGNHPNERTNDWADNAQGVTHDAEHWYISNDGHLFKYHISTNISSNNYVKRVGIPQELRELTFKKFKALVYYKGFLFVPMEAKYIEVFDLQHEEDPKIPDAIAMFRADDLSYVSRVDLLEEWALGVPGWLAIHPVEERLYTSSSKVGHGKGLSVFDLEIHAGGLGFNLTFSHHVHPRMVAQLSSMQGGTFSPEGEMFLINGYYNTDVSKGGINVFGMHDFYFRQKSTQKGLFRFQWDTSIGVAEEPEGMTFWDLDEDNRAPHIGGQLHAILLDNDLGNDDVYMKHYRMSDPKPYPIPKFYLQHAFLRDDELQIQTDTLRGITNNQNRIFLAATDKLYSLPLPEIAGSSRPMFSVSWPAELQGFDHIGDITSFETNILVPFSSAARCVIASFKTENLQVNTIVELAHTEKIAFIGVNALTRSHLHAFDTKGNIRKYAIELQAGQLRLTSEGEKYHFNTSKIPHPITKVTGGEISSVSGFYYVVHDGQITVFHSDGSFVDSSAIKYNMGISTFEVPDKNNHDNKFITTDCWPKPMPNGLTFDNISDVSALAITAESNVPSVIRNWEILSMRLIGNKRSKEIHLKSCSFYRLMNPKNYVPFSTIEEARSRGFNGCYYCLPGYDDFS